MSVYAGYIKTRILLSVKDGSKRIKDIHREIEVTYSTISKYLKVMNKEGLIKYGISKTDKRAKEILITKKGFNYLQITQN